MSKKTDISQTVERLKREILSKESELWEKAPSSFIDYCDPEVAARVIGYEVRYEESLGQFGEGNDKFEVAGCIKHNQRLILVSRQFSLQSQRFTLAHEVAHAYLQHPGIEGHRERPIMPFSTAPKPPLEREADRFAALLLVTPKLLKQEFERIWGPSPLEIDEHIAYVLDPNDPDTFLRSDEKAPLRRASTIARFTGNMYTGGQINSLAETFKVSVEMMSYRLMEEQLIKDWP